VETKLRSDILLALASTEGAK